MLENLKQALQSIKADEIDAARFARQWRAETACLAGILPERYCAVLDDLLVRLESSALFNQESCSFSREDLLSHLEVWLAKAEQYLQREKFQGIEKEEKT